MKGHIRQRAKGSWSIVLDLGRDANGKRKQKWVTVQGGKKDAERELRRLLTSMDEGSYVDPSKLTVGEYLKQWLDSIKHSIAGSTYEGYSIIVEHHLIPALGTMPLQKLKAMHIENYYAQARENGRKGKHKGGLSERTLLHHHVVLQEALSKAVKWKMLTRSPMSDDAVAAPSPASREIHVLDEKQTARLLEIVRGRHMYVPVLLAVTTGMRRGEICALRWKDVDLARGTIAVRQSLEHTSQGLKFKEPKTKKSRRSIALATIAVEALRAHKVEQTKQRLMMGKGYQDHGLVVCKVDGTPYPPKSLTSAFSSLIRRTKEADGLRGFSFHGLRHTHATQLLRQGVHPKVVSERLGHSSIGITLDTYSHVLPGMQEEAASKVDEALRAAIQALG